MKVVVFKLNSLGDNVVFVPCVQAMRRWCPDWHVVLVTTPSESELYRGPLGPQEMIICPKPRFNKAYRRPWELARWIWRIRRIRPDACLIAYDQSNVAHFVARLSGARVRVGGNLERIRVARSLTVDVPIPGDRSPALWSWMMARELARAFGRDGPWPEAPPRPDLTHLGPGAPRGAGGRQRVVVHSGSGRVLNQWSRERFASVASSLSRDFEVVWVMHGAADGPAPGGTVAAPVDSIAGLAGWLAGADLFLGNNSGPMHVANALGCPGVAVTGPSATGWDPFWDRDQWTVLRHPDLACVPCDRTTVAVEGCANLASPMACLKYWTEDKVEAACRSRLGGGARRAP
jgi:ADP-heptose:LPS heptosyltransferase